MRGRLTRGRGVEAARRWADVAYPVRLALKDAPEVVLSRLRQASYACLRIRIPRTDETRSDPVRIEFFARVCARNSGSLLEGEFHDRTGAWVSRLTRWSPLAILLLGLGRAVGWVSTDVLIVAVPLLVVAWQVRRLMRHSVGAGLEFSWRQRNETLKFLKAALDGQ